MKAYACVGTHGKIYYCASSATENLRGRLEVFFTRTDAERNAISKNDVREVTITIHKLAEDKKHDD